MAEIHIPAGTTARSVHAVARSLGATACAFVPAGPDHGWHYFPNQQEAIDYAEANAHSLTCETILAYDMSGAVVYRRERWRWADDKIPAQHTSRDGIGSGLADYDDLIARLHALQAEFEMNTLGTPVPAIDEAIEAMQDLREEKRRWFDRAAQALHKRDELAAQNAELRERAAHWMGQADMMAAQNAAAREALARESDQRIKNYILTYDFDRIVKILSASDAGAILRGRDAAKWEEGAASRNATILAGLDNALAAIPEKGVLKSDWHVMRHRILRLREHVIREAGESR